MKIKRNKIYINEKKSAIQIITMSLFGQIVFKKEFIKIHQNNLNLYITLSNSLLERTPMCIKYFHESSINVYKNIRDPFLFISLHSR